MNLVVEKRVFYCIVAPLGGLFLPCRNDWCQNPFGFGNRVARVSVSKAAPHTGKEAGFNINESRGKTHGYNIYPQDRPGRSPVTRQYRSLV
jgi:hypothetical protein